MIWIKLYDLIWIKLYDFKYSYPSIQVNIFI